MTPAERKAAERQRRKDAGLVRCEVWVHPQHVQAIRDEAEELTQTVRNRPIAPPLTEPPA